MLVSSIRDRERIPLPCSSILLHPAEAAIHSTLVERAFAKMMAGSVRTILIVLAAVAGLQVVSTREPWTKVQGFQTPTTRNCPWWVILFNRKEEAKSPTEFRLSDVETY